ncbi:hypothetical protein THOM_2656 [Trachipleistophora hominis]|uniref:Uncharacterized protein n=1 Tax=Trachipleistophora hominis TaxID=72359 RepID=L7JUI6_TRAHO|nr:hypothetical protein THOM_2656 [Trachipleistophora hominis]
MLHQPNVLHIVKKFYKIRLYLRNTNLIKVGVAKNVLFVSPISINSSLVYTLNEKLIFKEKIINSTNHLLAIEVKGIITQRQLVMVLKKCLPTVFNVKVIKKMNNEEKVRNMYIHIKQSLVNILGACKGKKVMDEIFEDQNDEENFESEIESGSGCILSDFEII